MKLVLQKDNIKGAKIRTVNKCNYINRTVLASDMISISKIFLLRFYKITPSPVVALHTPCIGQFAILSLELFSQRHNFY